MHGNNREKVRVGNHVRIYLNDCSDLLLLGGCSCAPFLNAGWQPRLLILLIYAREWRQSWPDMLSNWALWRSNFLQEHLAVYEWLNTNPKEHG